MPVLLEERQFEPWLRGEAGLEYLKPPPNDFLQKWPVSKRVNSSRADPDDSTLIEKVELAVAVRFNHSGNNMFTIKKCGIKVSGCGTRHIQSVVKWNVGPYSWRERLAFLDGAV